MTTTMPESIPEKIKQMKEAIKIIREFQKNLPQNIDGEEEPFDLSCLTPHLRAMNSLAPELPTMDPALRIEVQETVNLFRHALDDLLQAATQHKDNIIEETNKARGHTKSTAAYLKASSNGALN